MLKKLYRPQNIMFFILVSTLFSIVFLLLLNRNMHRWLSHDEHLFIASGKLLANKLLIPYRDYPYIHMPNLVFVYAAIFKYTNHNLLAARLFSLMCGWLTLLLLFVIGMNLFRRCKYLIRFLIATGAVVLLLVNPLFIFTSGRAWNHDLPVLLSLLAFVFHCHGTRQEKAKKWVFLSGILLGFAIGTRLSFAPLIVPFLIVIFLFPNVTVRKRKLYLLLSFGFGVFLTMLPTLLMFALAPKQFMFGNIGYREVSVIRRQQLGWIGRMTVAGKLIYFITDVVSDPGNLLLVLTFIFLIFSMSIIKVRAEISKYFEVIFILILIPFLLIGSFAPTPSFEQYLYAPIPFLVLGILYGMASFYDQDEKMKCGLKLFALIIIISSIYGLPSYRHNINTLLLPNRWLPIIVHKFGIEIKTAVGEGKVLTLAPIFPLEGGLEIYEEFATGPFAWRTAPFLPENKRRDFGMISESDLNDFLRTKQPRGILVGFERGDLEKPLVNYAEENGYRALELSNEKTLWLSSY